ncbi:MAG: hypothetical protein WC538_06685 [Thermoanaerobaculia bacterium]|jgi:hypothetical protein
MKTYDYAGPDSQLLRAHPWTVSTGDPAGRYYDLRAEPGLIRTSLEDFLPWSAWPAVETFYQLLEWLNGADSTLETNDCALQGPAPNATAASPRALEVTGRLMILWRSLPMNLPRANVEWLRMGIHRHLSTIDLEFSDGAVGITICRVRFRGIRGPERRKAGFQLMLSFWAWGDAVEDSMANLARCLRNLGDALRAVEREAHLALDGHGRGA